MLPQQRILFVSLAGASNIATLCPFHCVVRISCLIACKITSIGGHNQYTHQSNSVVIMHPSCYIDYFIRVYSIYMIVLLEYIDRCLVPYI